MNGRYILIVVLIIALCCFFRKGSFFEIIKETIHLEFTSHVAWILDKYAYFNKKIPIEKTLTYAILSGNANRAMSIILKEENINFLINRFLTDKNGKPCSVLVLALKYKQERIALLLLSYWCDVCTPDYDGHTPLYYARKWNMDSVIKKLKRMKAPE